MSFVEVHTRQAAEFIALLSRLGHSSSSTLRPENLDSEFKNKLLGPTAVSLVRAAEDLLRDDQRARQIAALADPQHILTLINEEARLSAAVSGDSCCSATEAQEIQQLDDLIKSYE